MDHISKLLNELIFKPIKTNFKINKYKNTLDDIVLFDITIELDSSRIHKASPNYDEKYYSTIENIGDHIYNTLKYINEQDNLMHVNYEHVNTTFISDFIDKLKKFINDTAISISNLKPDNYVISINTETLEHRAEIIINIYTKLPIDTYKKIRTKIYDLPEMDDLIINWNNSPI